MAGRSAWGQGSIEEDFERIYREHSDTVLRFCLRRTGDLSRAEDLCAAVFYAAWRRRNEVDLTGRNALPWLYAVATNAIRNERRSLRRAKVALHRLPAAPAEPDATDEVVDRVDASSRSRLALARLKELPQAERDVLVLCVGRDRTYRDAARELHIPIGTVRSRLARARARLDAYDPCQADSQP